MVRVDKADDPRFKEHLLAGVFAFPKLAAANVVELRASVDHPLHHQRVRLGRPREASFAEQHARIDLHRMTRRSLERQNEQVALEADISPVELAFPRVLSDGDRDPVFVWRENYGADRLIGWQAPGALLYDLVQIDFAEQFGWGSNQRRGLGRRSTQRQLRREKCECCGSEPLSNLALHNQHFTPLSADRVSGLDLLQARHRSQYFRFLLHFYQR